MLSKSIIKWKSIVNIHSFHSFNLHRNLSVKMALVGVVILKTILLTEVDLSTLSKFQVLLWIKSSWETVCSLKVGKKIMYYFTSICRLHTKINNMAQSYMYITYDELWRNGTQRKYKKVCQLGRKPRFLDPESNMLTIRYWTFPIIQGEVEIPLVTVCYSMQHLQVDTKVTLHL